MVYAKCMYTRISTFAVRRYVMVKLTNILIMIGSIVSTGFGIWHLFVPKIWSWYSYIDINAKELILAVKAINVFFSLSLILFGTVNILLAYGNKSNKYSMIVVLSATCVLWLTRLVFQTIYPQGTINPFLQYGVLATFIGVFLCYLISLCMVVAK
jgi:hypothetical protein